MELISPPDAGGYDFDFQPREKGEEIVIYGKWTEAALSTVAVLAWNGSRLMPDPEQARLFFQRRLDAELQDVLSRTPKPAADRVNKARTVVDLLMKGSDYKDALELCNELLEMINNNALTVPLPRPKDDVAGLSKQQRGELADTERLHALSAVHMMLARIYNNIGRKPDEEQERAKAQALSAAANGKLEHIYHLSTHN